MKKVNNILYLTDEAIYLKNNKIKNIIKYKINKGVITNGKIANINKFISVYEKLLSENKLNNSLFGETIKIIIHPLYTNADINLLKNIFESLNYRRVSVEYETKYYKLNTTNCYLNIHDSFILLTYINEYKKTITKLIPDNFFSEFTDTLAYIASEVPNKAVSAGSQSCSTDKIVLTTCISFLKFSLNIGLIGLSIKRAASVAASVGLPSLLINPPGILPTEYNFS